ncbi:MAG: fibronectin type III domain-containing protein, partial [Bacteroidota bacterium]
MNHLTQSLRRLVAAALVLLTMPAFAQLSGTYTIDPNGTGTSNYASFTAAVSALTTSGVSGPVTFNVAAGTYNEQIVIGAITGSSATNRVTFQKAPSATGAAVLTFAGTSTANYTIQLAAASNLTFKDLTLANTTVAGQTVGGIVEYGGTVSNIQFINNTFSGNAGTNTSNSWGALRYGSTPSTGYASGVWKFVGNTFNNVSYSANVYGSTTVNADTVVIQNNTINGTYYHIYTYYAKNVVITGNTLTTSAGTLGYNYVYYPAQSVVMTNNTMSGMAYGMYSFTTTNNTGTATYNVSNNVVNASPNALSSYGFYIGGSSTAANKIAKVTIKNNTLNLVGSSTIYGIYTSYVGATSADPSEISNNMISCIAGSTASVYGYYPFHVANLNFDHNTIHVTGGSATAGRALYINRSTSTTAIPVSGLNIRNNIVSNTGLGYAVEIASTANTAAMIGAMSNNAYQGNAVNPFRAGTTPTNYTTLADWQTATSKDAGSAFGTILFYNNSDLHVQNALANNIGTPLASVTTDIDGQTRSTTTPDAGADEYSPLSCVSAAVITVPTVGGTSATASWTTTNTPTSYKVRYRTQGAGAWTTVAQTAATLSLTGLQSFTTYEVQVKEFCSATDSSIWSGSTTFTTAIVPNWTENFQGGFPPTAWTRATGRSASPTVFTSTTSSNWAQDDYGNLVPNGPNGKSARINIYSTNHFHWLMSPSIEIPNNALSYQVEYDLALTTWNATTANFLGVDDTLALFVSLNNGATWDKTNMIKVYTAADTITPAGRHVIIPVPTAWKGSVIKFGWYSQSTVSNADNDIFVDNFQVKDNATC